MSPASGNLFADLPRAAAAEEVVALLQRPGLTIERIVSTGQATPAGEWLDQEREEWVVLLRGAAGLRFEGEANPRLLAAGDYLRIPAHCRHRVEWTAAGEPTVWLALHYS
jgi:cupin 2 domain-containing protein